MAAAEEQAVVAALACACPPHSATEAAVLLVHASCLLHTQLQPLLDDKDDDTWTTRGAGGALGAGG